MAQTITLEPFTGSFGPDDPDANFKAEVAEYSRIDAMPTLEGMSRNFDIPTGALAAYILAKYATACSDGVLHMGPRVIHQMVDIVKEAEAAGTDEARLKAYRKLCGIVSWLEWPLVEHPRKL